MMLLGVNIDHVATLRQARYAQTPMAHNREPSVLEAALEAERAGAHSITAHLREDRRHIQDADIHELRAGIATKLNLEMGNAPEIVEIAVQVRPHFACLVPEKRQEVTTEGGLDVIHHAVALSETTRRLQAVGTRVSYFIDPEPGQVAASAQHGADMVELHTGTYANSTGAAREAELERLIAAARQAFELGLQVNAGHGITTENLRGLFRIPHLTELNIGHHLIARAVFVGLRQSVKEMLGVMARLSAMNIHGIGTDLVETARIASALERLGDAFLKRCFTESEIAYCQRHANTSLPFAARWAAKEAIAKAFGTGIGPEMSLVELEIVKLPSGQPTVVLHGNALKHAHNLGMLEIKISLTHTDHYAAAYAMILVGAMPDKDAGT